MKAFKLLILSVFVVLSSEASAQCNMSILRRDDVLKKVDNILTRAVKRRAFLKNLKLEFMSEFKTDTHYWNKYFLARKAYLKELHSGEELYVQYKIYNRYIDHRFERKYDKYGRFLGCTVLLDRDVDVRNAITDRLVFGFMGLNSIECSAFDCKPVKIKFDESMNLID